MTEILIKLFTVLSKYGFTPSEDKEDDKRIHFHKTINKAIAEIVVDVMEDKNSLRVFYDLKNQYYFIIDSAESFDCTAVHYTLLNPSISIPAPVIEEIIPQKREKSIFEELFCLDKKEK